jgi:uncharacterized protein (DUF58 family)
MLQGEHPSRYMGLGIEYEGIREYNFGDDYRRIEWSVSARTPPKPSEGSPLFIKQYREEKNLNVLLVLDQSGSMEYKSKVLVAVRAALVLGDLAQRRGDYVGVVCFRNRVNLFLPPARSGEQSYRVLRTLCQFYRTGETSNLKTTAIEIIRALQKRSIVNLITDINHDAADYVYFTRLMWARGHVTNIMLVADESEITMPEAGWLTLTESEELARITIDTSELKSEYDKETRYLLKRIFSGCAFFGAKVLLLKSLKEVDSKILEIARLYRFAREGVYR